MSSNGGGKMKSIEEEMSRFEEEIMSLTQDPTPIGGAVKSQEHKASSFQFQPRQTQGRERIPRAPGFQPRQMGRPGGNMSRPNRPSREHHGFVPHQVRANQRPQGPPRFPHLPPPPPPPPMDTGGPMGPMPNMVPPNMMGPLPPPPMPPFAMMPPAPPNLQKPVTLSAKPTTYASKPVLNKKSKKKVKKEKSTESKDEPTAIKKEAKKNEEPAVPSIAPPDPSVPQEHNVRSPMPLPPPPAIPQAFNPVPTPTDLTQGGAYELGTASEPLKKKDKKKKHIRVAAGTTWEDDSLAEWDPNDFRLFAGDLGNEVTEDTLTKVFGSYPSYIRCKIIRDKRTNKTKGYGFVSFKDPRDFVQAMKDWNGKYVGNRPIKLLKSTWKDRDVSSVKKKQKEKDRLGLR
ncbi:RNA-binding protein 42-like isoform X1 [Lytechinus pictus]|uniref:RNA-binding protein 42-like isoform X1 n=2 Tax=Lytechinus pictus TaxID=7653 RepID=UPI0030B9BAD1